MKQLPALFFLLFFAFLVLFPPKVFAAEELMCKDPQEPGADYTSRPYAFPLNDEKKTDCKTCNRTDKLEADCATTVTAKQNVTFTKGDGDCVEKTWGGTVTINAQAVTIPFVGHKVPAGTPVADFEQKYLADYFEGTSEYYQQYANYWFDNINHAGVFRKLAPLEYQNQIKEQMAKKAKDSVDKAKANNTALDEGRIHDYKILYKGRLCWDTPFTTDLFIALLKRVGGDKIFGIDALISKNHYCMFEGDSPLPILKNLPIDTVQKAIETFNAIPLNIFKISFYRTTTEQARLTELLNHFPPSPLDKDYVKKYEAWKTQDKKGDEKVGKWYKLWQATMMFTREDTPGYIFPRMGTKINPDDKTNEKDIPLKDEVEKVPHVARLYEASKQVAQLILPFGSPGEEEPRLLIPTQAPRPPANACGQEGAVPSATCDKQAITDTNPNDSLCCGDIGVQFTAVDKIENQAGYAECQASGGDPAICGQIIEKTLERKFEVNLEHPYLKEIWNQTSNALVVYNAKDEPEIATMAGVFNAFRPYEVEKFPDLDARSKDQAGYTYDKGQTEPTSGQFYFNHLGGVELGKEWVLKALWPFKQ